MELKVILFISLVFSLSAYAQFLPTTWTDQENQIQMENEIKAFQERRKIAERKAMELQAAQAKKLSVKGKVEETN